MQNLSSAAVVIGALRVKSLQASGGFCCLLHFANCLDPDQDQQNVSSVLDPNCLTLIVFQILLTL